MKTIKIIDLLIKIANGEEVPKKIKFDNQFWDVIYGEKNIYYTNYCNDDLFIVIFKKNLTFTLNDKAEILEEEPRNIEVCGSLFTKSGYDKLTHSEEEKKIPERLKIEQDTSSSNFYIKNEFGTQCNLTKHSKIIADKINEILDYLERKGE